MAKFGLERRAVVEDNLAGQANIQPVFLRGSGITTPRMPPIPPSPAEGLMNALGDFANKQIQARVNAQKERQRLDGATMAVQGLTVDQVQTAGGDINAIEGFNVMRGVTTSSALVAAQIEQIEQGGFAMSLDQFRANYTARMEDAIRGQSPEIATAIRDEFTKQMPNLVAKHTTMHIQHLEEQNYDALVQSIDVLSQDPDGGPALFNFASFDENSASSGLSDKRKQAAISRGVQQAFRNDNPLGYGFLRKAGLLEQLTLEQRNAVEASKAAYQGRMRSQANAGMVAALQGAEDEMMAGNLDESAYIMRVAEILSENHIEITRQEQADLYRQAGTAQDTKYKAKTIQLEAAVLAKDWPVASKISADMIEHIESNGNPYAIGPLILGGANKGTNAEGSMQTTLNTQRDPGYGVTPVRNNSPAEKRRLGRDYWAVLYSGRDSGFNLPWDGGDIEAAAIAYNAGPGNAIKWIEAGRNYNVLPDQKQSEGYWKKIQKHMDIMRDPTVADKYNTAVALLAQTEADVLVEATDVWNQNMAGVYEDFSKSSGSPIAVAAFRKASEIALEASNLAKSQATVAIQNQRQEAILKAMEVERTKAEAAEAKLRYTVSMADNLKEYARVHTDLRSTPAEVAAVDRMLMETSGQAMQEAGVQEIATGLTKVAEKIIKAQAASQIKFRQRALDVAVITKALDIGNISDLNERNKKEAFEKAAGNLDQKLGEVFNKAGKSDRLTKDVMDTVSNNAFAQLWSRLGTVDPDVRRENDAAVIRGLVDKDGNANADAVAAIQRYKAVKDADPLGSIAPQFLNEKARALAEAVLFNAGPGGDIGEAVGIVGRNINKITPAQVEAIVTTEKMEADIKAAIESRADEDVVGVFRAIFSGEADLADVGNHLPSEVRNMTSEEEVAKQFDAVADEVRRLVIRNPNNRPDDLLDMAVANVKLRSANVLGNWVQMNFDLKQKIFGSRAANVDKEGIVNTAIIEYLTSPQMLKAHPGIGDVSFTEIFPGGVQDALLNLPGGLVDWTRGLSSREAKAAIARGLRPGRSFVGASGNNLFVIIVNQEGNDMPQIRIDLEAVGAYYFENHGL